MLQQLREGLGVYNFINVMERKPDERRSLFVVGQDDKVDSDYILSHIAPELSPQGSIKQAKETKILEYFQDFLYELEALEAFILIVGRQEGGAKRGSSKGRWVQDSNPGQPLRGL
ncbi:hypothetical protein AMECASPLE_020881 [Ameca splendens]|uniref:Uncharacterized protein n=1 Tax=Ameca splendens TaxID=208324 RepID=A0ABV0XSP3_9TELE